MRPRSSRLLRFAVFALLLVAAGAVRAGEVARGFVFAVEAAADRDQAIDVFYESGTGWSGAAVVRRDLRGDGAWHRLEFPLPAVPLRQLRLDPGWGGATLRFRGASLLAADGAALGAWVPPPFKPVQQIASSEIHDGVLTVTHPPGANDPILLLDAPLFPLVQPHLVAQGWPRWVAPTLAAVLALALLAALGVVARALARSLDGDARNVRAALGFAAGVFLVVLGLRLAWIGQFGSPVPYNDEWDSEARVAVLSWQSRTLDAATLAAPHNEHRLVLSRLAAIGTTALRGTWDPRSGMALSAACVAALAALVALLIVGTRDIPPVARGAALLALTVLAALPSDRTNLIWGGQTQMYLLLLLGGGVIAAACAAPRRVAEHAALLALAVLSLGSMGSGFVAPALAALLVVAVRLAGDAGETRPAAPTPPGASRRPGWWIAAPLALVAAAGFLVRAEAPHHAALHAASFAEWSETFGRLLAWPATDGRVAAAWWLPWLALAVVAVVRRGRIGVLGWFALGVGAWLTVQNGALAFARARAHAPEPRHLSLLMLTPVATTLACLALGQFARGVLLRCAAWGLAPLAPLVVAAWVAGPSFRDLTATHELRDRQAEMLRVFLATGDRRVLTDDARTEPPYQNPIALAGLLEEPALRERLPAELRAEPGYSDPTVSLLGEPGFILAALGLALAAGGFRVLARFRDSPVP